MLTSSLAITPGNRLPMPRRRTSGAWTALGSAVGRSAAAAGHGVTSGTLGGRYRTMAVTYGPGHAGVPRARTLVQATVRSAGHGVVGTLISPS